MTETNRAISEEGKREEATLVDIQFRSPTMPWGIASFRREDGTTFAATGEFGQTILYEDYIMYGQRVPDIEGGDFEVSQFTSKPPKSVKAIPGYLSALTGASRSATAKLVEHFGEATIDVIERTPELLDSSGISERDIERLVTGWKTLRSDRLALSKIEVEGIPFYKLSKLQRFYGNDADLNQLIKSDPYCLYIHFDDTPFSTAMRLANRIGVSNQTESAVRGAVIAALRREAWLGHSVLEGRAVGEAVMRLLRITPDLITPLLGPAVAALRKLGLIHVQDKRIQLKYLHDAEHHLFHLIEEWSARDESELEFDLVPSEVMGLKILKPMRLKQGDTKQLLTGISALLSECFAIVQCQTFEDQLFVARALALIFKAYSVNAVITTYTLEMLNEAASCIDAGLPMLSYAELIGLDCLTGIPTQRSTNPVIADAIIVLGADALGIEEMNHLIEAVPKDARLYLLGCPKDLPSLSVGQPFADLIDSQNFKAFHSRFWGVPPTQKREAQEAMWAGMIEPDIEAFDPTQPISWLKCDQAYLPSLIPELVKQVAEHLDIDPLMDIRVVAPATAHGLVKKVQDAIVIEFAEPNNEATFQGRKFHQRMPIIIRQPLATADCPAFSVFQPSEIASSEMTVVGLNKAEATIKAEDRVDVFDAVVMSPKFLRGRRYELVVLLAIGDLLPLINQELLSGLMNASRRSLVIAGEIEQVANGIAARASSRTRSTLLHWVNEK